MLGLAGRMSAPGSGHCSASRALRRGLRGMPRRLVVGGGGVNRGIVVQWTGEPGEQAQADLRSRRGREAGGDGSIEGDDRRGVAAVQLVVETLSSP